MTDKLPPNLLVLFQPRPKLKHLEPVDHALEQRHTSKIEGVGAYLDALREYKENDNTLAETHMQRQDRIKREKKDNQEKQLAQGLGEYNPKEDPNIRGSAYKTLFVGRLHWDTDSKELEDAFSRYGRIERVRPPTCIYVSSY